MSIKARVLNSRIFQMIGKLHAVNQREEVRHLGGPKLQIITSFPPVEEVLAISMLPVAGGAPLSYYQGFNVCRSPVFVYGFSFVFPLFNARTAVALRCSLLFGGPFRFIANPFFRRVAASQSVARRLKLQVLS